MAKRSRPSEFRAAYVEHVRALCEAGVRDLEIARLLNVSRSTLLRWQAARPELFAARRAKHEVARRPPSRLKYRPELCETARALYAQGSDDADVADALGLSESTIWRWRREHIEFGEAAKAGRAARWDSPG